MASPAGHAVTFFLPGVPDLEVFRRLDPDRDAGWFDRGEYLDRRAAR